MSVERFSDLAVIAMYWLQKRFEVEVDEICKEVFGKAHPRKLLQASLFDWIGGWRKRQTTIVVALYS